MEAAARPGLRAGTFVAFIVLLVSAAVDVVLRRRIARHLLLTATVGCSLAGCGADASPSAAPSRALHDAELKAAESELEQREAELARLRSELRAERVRNEQGERAAGDETATTARPLLSMADARSFRRLTAGLGGRHGLAVSDTGTGQAVKRLGTVSTAVAWSTAKVPVAMAVIYAGGASRQHADLARAITASDNAAALRLWQSLGGGDAAAAAATRQLRRGGDRRTVIESRSLRGSAYTAFGQTAWALTDQARFVAGLACSPAGRRVLTLMGQVVSGQRWGLAVADDAARFKGGWGPGSRPGEGGGYLDRQMGVIVVRGRPLAVTIVTSPADGSHESGVQNLTAIARWLVRHVDTRAAARVPFARCAA